MTRDEIIRRGESASRLLTDATALAAWDAIKEQCLESIYNSGPHQDSLRDDAYRLSRCIKLVRVQLETWRDEAAMEIHNGDPKKIVNLA